MNEEHTRERINVVIAGHVDHGKSTIVGRLLADSGAVPDGKLAQVKAYCERNAKPFEYAFLIDALKAEQSQGVTIDSARVFFRVGGREYLILDAPGHVEFVRNMVTGASRADAALLVIDAKEGIQENSRRHGKLLGLLGIRQVVVLVNKMDLVGFAQETFDAINGEYSAFLREAGVTPIQFIPVSGMRGDNIVQSSTAMGWYSGATVVEVLKSFRQEGTPSEKPFRMWLQDVYKFTNDGDTRRIVAGTIETGSLSVGDQVIFYPSGKKSVVESIETFPARQQTTVQAGEAAGFTLSEQVYLGRGELAIKIGDPRPSVTSRLRASLFWLGRDPMIQEKEYTLKIGATRVPCRLEQVRSVQDVASLANERTDKIDRYTVADCDLQLGRAIAFDPAEEVLATGRFVVVDRYEICGGGIVREALKDRQTWVREKVLLRDYRWERSTISAEERAARFRQRPALVIITGKKDSGKKPIARALEQDLLVDGYLVYFLGIGNILYGVDADIRGQADVRKEDIRRLAEVAHILLEAGFILIVTAIELTQEELETIHTGIESDQIVTVWRGAGGSDALRRDLSLGEDTEVKSAAQQVGALLRDLGILGKR